MTGTTVAVLEYLLGQSDSVAYGLEIGAATGLASGTIHPILARLEGVGWLSSDWEDIDASAAGRPRRRYYRLTGEGVHTARSALAARQAAIDARRRPPVRGAPRPATSIT